MLTFLRRIRQSLIDAGATRKYLLYAIGEIALVVIGILIALQINNWNEWRKDRALEKELLIELKMTLTNNHEILSGGLNRWRSTTEAIQIITEVIIQKLPYTDSLSEYFRYAHQNRGNILNGLDFTGYKALENSGLSLLRNRTIRSEIAHLFETRLSALAASNEQLDLDNSGFHYEYITQNFIKKGNREIPLDFNKILKDPFYFSILKGLEDSLNRKIQRVNRYLRENQRVLELIEEELAEKGK